MYSSILSLVRLLKHLSHLGQNTKSARATMLDHTSGPESPEPVLIVLNNSSDLDRKARLLSAYLKRFYPLRLFRE